MIESEFVESVKVSITATGYSYYDEFDYYKILRFSEENSGEAEPKT